MQTMVSVHVDPRTPRPKLKPSGQLCAQHYAERNNNALLYFIFSSFTEIQLTYSTVFPVVVYECESWPIKKADCQRIDTFELWCWRKLLRVPWTPRRSNQSILILILVVYRGPWCFCVSLNWCVTVSVRTLRVSWSAILDLAGSSPFMSCPWAMSFF